VGGERPPGRHTAGQGDGDTALSQLAERTADLQRLQAEYANYRKRVERDRAAVREQALANVLAELLPVLDDIGRAREHGELSGGFKSIAESFESAVAKLGLTSYGEKGDTFDPVVHEALMHSYADDVTEPTCVQILQPGYKIGDRILRPARVAVAEPGGSTAGETDDDTPGETSRKGGTSPQEAPADSNG
jgi:molecular chaperone GrpE